MPKTGGRLAETKVLHGYEHIYKLCMTKIQPPCIVAGPTKTAHQLN